MEEHRYDPYNADRDENPYSGYYGTGVPKQNRKRGHGLLIFAIAVLAAILLCGTFLKKYSVLVERNDQGISIIVEEREKARLREEEERAGKTESAEAPPAAVMIEKSVPEELPAVVLGSGAELSISPRRIGIQTAVTDEDG